MTKVIITAERHLVLLRNKLTIWQNTYVDAGDDAEIGRCIGNEKMEQNATARMKQALQTIRWIETKMTELETQIDKPAAK